MFQVEVLKLESSEFQNLNLSTRLKASEALQSLGLVLPFNPSGGLRDMVSNSPPLFVSQIVQNSFIQVDEKALKLPATVACLRSSCGRRVKLQLQAGVKSGVCW